MSTIPGRGAVIDATDALVDALDAELKALHQQGADDLSAGRLSKVRDVLDRIERVQVIRNRVVQDRDDLLTLYPPASPEELDLPDESFNCESHRQDRTNQSVLNQQREWIVDAISARFGATLKRQRQAMFLDDRIGVRVVCTISKEYGNGRPFWYAFHPKWGDFLRAAPNGILALGMMERDVFVSLPHAIIEENLDKLHRTERPDGSSYWHLHISEPELGRFRLALPKAGGHLELISYAQKLS